MKSKTKYLWQIFLVLVLAVSLVPIIAAPAPASALPRADMIGGVTGWTWEWCYNTPMVYDCDGGYPYNTNTRTSIMVVFDDCFDPASINASNFLVSYTTRQAGRERDILNEIPKAAEYHCWYEDEYTDSYYGLVFLTLANPMATDCYPDVELVDETGAYVDDIEADDGIAPMISIAAEGDPHAGGLVTVTATASEDLASAYLLTDCDSGLPTVDYFPIGMESPNVYGGYCGGVDKEGCWDSDPYWEDDNVVVWEFSMEAADPQDTFYVEVLAHDYTYCDGYWWLHEKWNTESVFLQGKDTLVMHLWEGWNLISFPRTPVDPTLRGVFSDMGVNKIYTFKNSRWYGSLYDIESGKWATPRGLRGISTVEPGVGYWVYCSPLGDGPDSEWYWDYLTGLASQKLGMQVYVNTVWNDLVVEVQPAGTAGAVPPSYRLQKGWNLVGVPVMGSLDLMQMEYMGGLPTLTHVPLTTVSDFLSGVDWSSLFWYLPTLTADYEIPDDGDMVLMWPAGYHGTTPATCDDPGWKVGFWMSAFSGLGVPFNLEEPVELAGYEDYHGEFEADMYVDGCDFNGMFEGETEWGDDFIGGLCGEINGDGTVSGMVGGEICRDCEDGGYDEDFQGTFTGWYDFEEGIPVGGSFTGVTDSGNIMQGTYGGNTYTGDPDFVGSVQGTIYPADAGLMETTVPVVMPGYGYWVYANQADVLVPVK